MPKWVQIAVDSVRLALKVGMRFVTSCNSASFHATEILWIRLTLHVCNLTCGATPTGAVRGIPNLLVVDIPLVESRNEVNVTTIGDSRFEACINAYVLYSDDLSLKLFIPSRSQAWGVSRKWLGSNLRYRFL